MELVLGALNGCFLRQLRDDATRETERVLAAVAYATEVELLLNWCIEKDIPLSFWGRFDETVPVSLAILRRFQQKRSPNFSCKLVRNFHSKVIWWQGYGAYIGSANLTNAAWYNNIEAGCFFSHAELEANGADQELVEFFQEVDKRSSPLTDELLREIEARRKELNRLEDADKTKATRFNKTEHVQDWGQLAMQAPKDAAAQRKANFRNEWNQTLQVLRDIAERVSQDAYRPAWVSADTPKGAQADQFLHAHYYQRTFEGNHTMYEQRYNENYKDPERAIVEALEWWRDLPSAPSTEDTMLNEWAPLLREYLAEDRLPHLTEDEFVSVCTRIHALRDHARRVANRALNLEAGRDYSIDEKSDCLGRQLYHARSASNATTIEMLKYVLYGGLPDDVPDRLWSAVNDPEWKIERIGISTLGEIVGWALPDTFPPRNGRTSKALRSLGYDVTVHSV